MHACSLARVQKCPINGFADLCSEASQLQSADVRVASADPDKMAAMFSKPAYAAQDWAHLCAWDYFVGQWIYLQGIEKNVFTRHSVLITFNTGALCVSAA